MCYYDHRLGLRGFVVAQKVCNMRDVPEWKDKRVEVFKQWSSQGLEFLFIRIVKIKHFSLSFILATADEIVFQLFSSSVAENSQYAKVAREYYGVNFSRKINK